MGHLVGEYDRKFVVVFQNTGHASCDPHTLTVFPGVDHIGMNPSAALLRLANKVDITYLIVSPTSRSSGFIRAWSLPQKFVQGRIVNLGIVTFVDGDALMHLYLVNMDPSKGLCKGSEVGPGPVIVKLDSKNALTPVGDNSGPAHARVVVCCALAGKWIERAVCVIDSAGAATEQP